LAAYNNGESTSGDRTITTSEGSGKTDAKVAKLMGVGEATVRRAKRLQKAAKGTEADEKKGTPAIPPDPEAAVISPTINAPR
jgi:transposase